MICRQASQTENALILRCQGTGCGAVRNTTVCQTARRSHTRPRSAALFATNVSTSR